MVDHVTREIRADIMRAVPSSNTSLELRLRKALWRRGLRYVVNSRVDGARPDVCFRGSRVAVFVDGCYWHGCPHCYQAPKTNTKFWTDKVKRNRQRDVRDTEVLRDAGWTVLRFWGCEIKGELDDVVEEVSLAVRPI